LYILTIVLRTFNVISQTDIYCLSSKENDLQTDPPSVFVYKEYRGRSGWESGGVCVSARNIPFRCVTYSLSVVRRITLQPRLAGRTFGPRGDPEEEIARAAHAH